VKWLIDGIIQGEKEEESILRLERARRAAAGLCLISAGSSVQVSFERLSVIDPAAPSDGTPAMASVARISPARRPVMVC
jgi:hypothetical protein